MNFRTIICSSIVSLFFAMPVFAADSVQVVSFSEQNSDDISIKLTGSKVITDDFSFKIPREWSSELVMTQNEDSYDIYDRTSYEKDESGLLFSIVSLEDSDYRFLEECTILGFYGNKTYVLVPYFSEIYDDVESDEFKACQEAFTSIKESFVSYIKETAT